MKKLKEQKKTFVPFKKNVRRKTIESNLGKNLPSNGSGADVIVGTAVGGEQLLNLIIDACDKLVAVGYYDVYSHTKEEIVEHLDDALGGGSDDDEQLGFMENFGGKKKLKNQEEVRVGQKSTVIEEKPDLPLIFDMEKDILAVRPRNGLGAKNLETEIGKIDTGLMDKLGLDLLGDDGDSGPQPETEIYAEGPGAGHKANQGSDGDSDSDTDIFG